MIKLSDVIKTTMYNEYEKRTKGVNPQTQLRGHSQIF